MRRSPSLRPFAAILSVALTATAFADDAQDLLEKSQQAMLNVPAMRMTMDSVDHTKNKTTNMVVEGKLAAEIVSSGHKSFMRRGDGPFQPMPGNVAEMIMNARSSAALQGVAEKASGVTLVGHENVNGLGTSVYTFQTNAMGLTVKAKVWISDQDNLPLKEENHTEGETKLGASPGVKVDRDATVTFDYDPSIKITLPTT